MATHCLTLKPHLRIRSPAHVTSHYRQSASQMSNFTSTIQGNRPLKTFQTLRDLWQQMTVLIGEDARLITEEDLNVEIFTDKMTAGSERFDAIEANASREMAAEIPQFSAIFSKTFNALLIGKASVHKLETAPASTYEIEITFTPAEIARFFQPLQADLPSTLKLPTPDCLANDSQLQSHFTQLLLAAIADDSEAARCEHRLSDTEIELQQQVAQAHLLHDISTQIHQNLGLDEIVQTAIEKVRTFLGVDRLSIYQFEIERVEGKIGGSSFDDFSGKGKICYEAIGSPQIRSVLNVGEEQTCFANRVVWDKYQAGTTKAIDSIDREYADKPCMLDLLHAYQVQSQSIVPIIVKDRLWGLLIAHQCQSSHQWQASEIQCLEQVAIQLAFAIHQANLDAASQWHTQNLEQRVNERTRELRDAVIVAQTANQSKTEFLALLSHELRTPLTSILGLSATLLRLPSLNLTDRQQNYLQTIHNSGEHLSELIDDILDFYKLEVGKTFLKVSEFSLSKLVKQVVEIVRAKAELGKIDLQIQIINDGNDVSQIGGRDLRFRGDTKRIRQVLLNILMNAIKFTPEHGTVIVRTWLEDRYAIFEIEDSGIGIEAEQIPRLFKKFNQLNPNYDRDYAGMGLGLAITQQLVELHGGWIDVDSIFGSGSTFTVRVASQPLQLPDRNDWDELDRKLVFQDPELNPTPKRIILIEQDEGLADFICDILTAARYQVTLLLSAESSFRQISMFQSDLLIVDLSDGEEVIDRLLYNIRKSPTIGDIKILAISDREDLLSPNAKQYVDDYLWKQVNPEQLLRKIAKLLSKV
jgi:two-component system, sensor histidine kinase and response regulator